MPSLTLDAKNTMLNALTIDTLSLHTAYEAAGGNEVVGGTPAYARLPVTFGTAAVGTRALSGAPYTFDIPATTVAWVGMWNAGAFIGMTPNGGTTPNPFAVDDLVADTLKSAHHGFVVTNTLVVWAGSNGPLPSGLTEGTIYYVVAVPSVDSLQISTTLGGDPVGLLITGNGYLQAILPVVSVAQGTFPVNALTLDATVAA